MTAWRTTCDILWQVTWHPRNFNYIEQLQNILSQTADSLVVVFINIAVYAGSNLSTQ